MLGSKCEEAKVLTRICRISKTSIKEQEWVKTQINSGRMMSREDLLSSVIEGYEKRVGEEVTDEEREILKEKSKLPVRYISLAKVRIIEENNTPGEKTRKEVKSKVGKVVCQKVTHGSWEIHLITQI